MFWYGWKGLGTRKKHTKYDSPMSHSSKVIGKVKVFAREKQTIRLTGRQTGRQTD